jgi:ATP-dependent Lon protease
MVLAQASLYSNRIVRSDVGMTGEVTLRGRVLPVGGIKMKILAAHRAGLNTVILPKRNDKDLDDVPAEVRDTMNFILVERIDEAIEAALKPTRDDLDATGSSPDRIRIRSEIEFSPVSASSAL